MNKLVFLLLFLGIQMFSQGNLPNDCANAIVVCGNDNFISNASGIGDTQEVAGCSGSEHNSLWLKVNIVQSGTLGFNLIPSDPSVMVDYDFWVYPANAVCGSLGSPIRCCTTNPNLAGLTSNVTGMIGTTITTTSGPGANGNGFVRWLTVTAGQFYYIAIDRPVGDGGFEIQWTGTATTGTGAFPIPPTANAIASYQTCSNTNQGIFDLNTRRALINSDTVNNQITFYDTEADAIDGENQLADIIGTTSQIIYAKVKNLVTECYTITSFNLVVNQIPVATMSVSDPTICEGENVTVSFNGTPGATIEYSIGGGTPQTDVLDSLGEFSFIDAPNSTIDYHLISVKSTDSSGNVICSRTYTNSLTVTVTPLPILTATPTATSICSGQSAIIDLSSDIVGTTYAWTVIQNGVTGASAGSGSGSPFAINQALTATGIIDGTVTYRITPTYNTCDGAFVDVIITVKPTPTLTATPTATSICSGENAEISLSSNIVGTTYSWTVVQSNVTGASNGSGSTINQALSSTGILSGTATYTIKPTFNGCDGADVVVTINVNPKPVLTATPTATSICSGQSASIALSSSIVGTTYSWTVTQSGVTGASNGSGSSINQILTASGTSNGIATYTIKPTFNGCDGDDVVVTINVNPKPVLTATPIATSICSGENAEISLSSNIVGTTYSWTVVQSNVTGATNGSGSVINQTLSSIGVLSGTATYTIKPTFNGCDGAVVVVTININPIPVLTATPTVTSICSGQSASIALSSSIAVGTIYNWTVVQSGVTGASNGSGSSINQALVASGTIDGTATYTIKSTYNGCDGADVVVSITVKPIPVLTATPTTTSICSGQSASIALSSSIVGTTYSWTVTQSGVTGASNGSGSSINQALTASGTSNGTATYTIKPTYNGCDGTVVVVTITVSPIPVLTATPTATTICSGQSASIALSSSIVAGTTYNWTVVQSGVTGASNGSGTSINQILTASGNSNGTAIYTITPTYNTCDGTAVVVTITVKPIPILTATPSATSICSGQSASITLSSSILGTTYNWTVVQSGVTGASNGSGSAINQTLTASGTSNGTATYTIKPIYNGCDGDVVVEVITVKPIPTVIATPVATTICSEQSTSIALSSPISGTTYNWTVVQNGVTGAIAGSGSIISQNLTVTGLSAGNVTYIITPEKNGCYGTPQNVVITVNPLPIVTATPSANAICSGSNAIITLSSNLNTTTFAWTVTQNNVIGATNGTGNSINQTLTATGTVAGIVTYVITPTRNGCDGTPVSVTISVSSMPTVIATPAQTSICSNYQTSIALSSPDSTTAFSWTVVQNGVTGAQAGSGTSISQTLVTTSSLVSGTATYTITPNNGCAGTPVSVTITVNPSPTVVANSFVSICSEETTNILLGTTIPGTTFTWTVVQNGVTGASDGSAVSIGQTLSTTSNAIGTAVYSIIPTANGCIGLPFSITVEVNPSPSLTLEDGVVCLDEITGNPMNSHTFYTGLNDTNYDFEWFHNGNLLPLHTQSSLTVNQVGTYGVIATNTVTGCFSDLIMTNLVGSIPGKSLQINHSSAFSDNPFVEINVIGGDGNYQYQLDNGFFQTSPLFYGIIPGEHEVRVIDSLGCTNLTGTFTTIGFIPFFTPNGDGYNDTWNIYGLENNPKLNINIFDRYGKLIKNIKPNSIGWDGTFNGQQLPSTDYWFTIDYVENGESKVFKSHFSLKR